MKTPSRFHRVVMLAFAAVCAAGAWADAYVWTGGGDGKWETPGNWRVGEDTPENKPGANDDVTIPSGANPVTVYEAFTVQSLTVGSGEGASVTVTFRHAGENHVKGNCLLEGAAFLTHEASGTAYAVNLKVDGNLTLAADAKINVDGKGYVKSNSPAGSTAGGWASYSVAAHGGFGANDAGYESRVDDNGGKTYGSIRFPFKAGAGGQSSAGGGRVKLTVGGALTVNGVVSANGAGTGTTGGAGGSVWITSASLAGGGTIAANTVSGGGGGGRVAVKLTDKTADFHSNWSGKILAYGGGAGTVYEQTGAQEDGFGTLIIDAGSPTAVSRTPISAGVTETDVGDLIVRNKANLQIHAGATLTVNGSILNNATFSGRIGGALVLGSTNDCVVSGTGALDLGDLRCETPGKRIVFADNFSTAIKANGTLTLRGTSDSPLQLLPQNAAKWKLTVGADATVDVSCVAVSNGNSSAGLSITDWDGTDLGGNSNWACVPLAVPGETNTWTGALSTSCAAKENWSRGRTPEATDAIRVPASAPRMPELTAAVTTWNRLVIDEGATLTFSGGTLSVTNACEVYGTLALPGTRQVNLGGDVTFGAATSLQPGDSRVTFMGNAPRTVRAAGVRFHRFELDATCGDVAFADGFSANVFRSRRPLAARLVTFADGAAYAWEEAFLDGRMGNGRGLMLAASEPGGTWNLTVERFALVRGANVSGCVANGEGSAGVRAFGSAGTGENPGWTFDPPRSFIWKDAASGSLAADANWEGEVAPGAGDAAYVIEAAGTVTVSDATTLGELVVGGGEAAVTLKASATVDVAGDVRVADAATAIFDRPVTAGGDLLVLRGGTITHTQSATDYAVDLTVTGAIAVDAQGSISANGKGYAAGKGPAGSTAGGWSSYSVAAHGGFGASDNGYETRVDGNGGKTYGSIRYPFEAGAGGQSSAGGGRVKLTVGGALTVNGTVTANGDGSGTSGGAGGSVWITSASLAGGGTIAANTVSGGGGGGRVAVKLTDKTADFHSNWSGKILAYGGGAGTVYEQTGAQEDGFGTLIVDAGSPSSVSRTPISAGVTETDVGDLIVRNKANFLLHAGATLTVNGSILNNATFSGLLGSTLVLDSTNDCVVSGTGALDLGDLRCETPGKRIVFADNFSTAIKANGTLTLRGTSENPLQLLPQNAAKWKLTVGADATVDVSYVAVSNGNSSAGLSITDWGGTDLGGNSNWACVPYAVANETNAWTGALSTSCAAKENWSLGRTPEVTDVIRVLATATRMPELTAAETTWNRLVIDEGATLTFSGGTLSVSNACEVYGTLALPGTRQVNLYGDVTFGAATSLQPGDSRVTFMGNAPRTVRAAGVRFHRLELDATCGDVAFADGFSANVFRSRRPQAPHLVTFADGATYVWEEAFLDGRIGSGRGLTLAASAGTWNLTVEHFALARGVNVSGCLANGEGSAGVRAFGSSGMGSNPGWTFDPPRSFVWKDAASGSLAAAENWEGEVAPGAGDAAYVIEAAGTVTISEATVLGELVVGGGEAAVTLQASAAVDVAGDVRVADAGTAVFDRPVTAGGDLLVLRGGTITHTQSATDYAVDLTVTGAIAVDAQGSIHANGKGYAASSGPTGSTAGGYAWYSVAAHGGFGESDVGYETRVDDNKGKTYGSIRYPFEAGAGGQSSSGGGRVKLTAGGALTVNGTVTANGDGSGSTAGAGGSVWVTAASLAGSGTVAANGNGGGGGRVAVKLTDKLADFVTTWDGKITAYGSGAGTVYEQTGAQADGLGTLIIDAGNLSNVGRTILAPYVTDQEAGEVIVRNKAKLEIRGANRKVSRFWRLSVDTGAVSVKIAEPIVLGDLDLRVSGSILSIGANKVTVRSRLHKDGRGWAKGWKISTAVDPASGEPGCVEWKCPGNMLIVR